jgi:hypothetical protein
MWHRQSQVRRRSLKPSPESPESRKNHDDSSNGEIPIEGRYAKGSGQKKLQSRSYTLELRQSGLG